MLPTVTHWEWIDIIHTNKALHSKLGKRSVREIARYNYHSFRTKDFGMPQTGVWNPADSTSGERIEDDGPLDLQEVVQHNSDI